MTVISRTVAATPERPASAAWRVIVDLLAPEDCADRTELMSVNGIASCLIADEAPVDDPITVHGSGPRIRIYCVYGEDAVTGEGVNEAPFTFSPVDGDWRMSFPCHPDDLPWVAAALAKRSTRITARALGAEVGESATSSGQQRAVPSVDKEAFLRS
ncbi:MAG: hypothetical protein ACRERX_19985 [Pseudomonas sp.]